MSKRLAAVLSLALGGALATGCNFGNAEFACDDMHLCKAGDTCQPGVNRCSFSDTTCSSGQRFGDLAGNNSNKCVGDTGGGGDDDAGGGGGSDGGIDSGTPIDPTVCYGEGTAIGKICFAAAPTNTIAINAVTTIDTGTSDMCVVPKSGGDGYCILLAKTITVDSTLRAIGTKPLVLLASDSITSTSVDALIDVSSKRSGATELGAGYDPATCTPVTTGAPKNTGGGAGGSFTGKGGSGGDGGGAMSNGGTPGDAVTAMTTLRGGCPGQDGAGMGGTGGHGGGAVFLFAVNKIDFKGTINAGGESGLGSAANKGGGGGAGAGGMIGFAAPMITIDNGVFANGGGGGEGVSQGGTAGNNGDDAAGNSVANGGKNGSSSGGDGGNGSIGLVVTGINGSKGTTGPAAGGGGGGGGAGLIKVPATATVTGMISPPATP